MNRVAALMLAVPLLQLNVLRADLACSSHDRADHSAQVESANHASEAHALHGAGEHSGAPADDGDTPGQPQCCQALASCSIVLGLDDDASFERCGRTHAGVASVLAEMPHSRAAAPDPPPPKV